MALSQYPTTVPAFAGAVADLANHLRFIRDSSGDLTYRVLFSAFDKTERAEVLYRAAVADMQISGAAADQLLSDLGGPENLATLQSLMGAVGTAKTAFSTALQTYLSNKTGSDLINVVTLTDSNGNDYQSLQYAQFIPSADAGAVRAAQQLANFITALEALGA